MVNELKRQRGAHIECNKKYSSRKSSLIVFGSCTYYSSGPSKWWPKVQIIQELISAKSSCSISSKWIRNRFIEWRGPGGTSTISDYLSDYKIIVYDELSHDRLIFIWNSVSNEKLYLLYDADKGHYNAITNIKAVMVKKYICDACDTLYYKTHKCNKICSLCTSTLPSTKDQPGYCNTCNRSFLSEKCFQNNLTISVKGKAVYQWRQVCRKCNFL
jgi:hypothetical protein